MQKLVVNKYLYLDFTFLQQNRQLPLELSEE